jgi:hypothetical protein
MSWRDDLRYDATNALLGSGHEAVVYWTRRDLLGEDMPKAREVLWNLKIPQAILRKQKADGSWAYPTDKSTAVMDYDQLETYRQLGFLVEMFGFDRTHPAIALAADYLLSYQTDEGDIRGIYAKQYTPNYTAAILELLIKAGYEDDVRIRNAFAWLDGARQHDGGWALAFRTQGQNLDVLYKGSERLDLDRSKPFSHLVTGVVLRAYAAHPEYRNSPVAKKAATVLVSRFFERDLYPDRNHKDDWTRFSFPFWQTDILSSLDSVGQIDHTLADHPKIQQVKRWIIEHQQPSGLFTGHLLKDRYHDLQLWYSYAICRALRRLD